MPEARYILFLFYQRLAVVAGRCLDWFSVNPDTLSGYTHTHTLVSRLQAEAALWAETLQNAMQNNNLPDTDAEYVDMQSSAARLPETPASFLTLKQNVGPIDLWILFCERICCVLLNNSADIRHPQVFFSFLFSLPHFFREGRELKRIRILNASWSHRGEMCSLRFLDYYVTETTYVFTEPFLKKSK